MVAAAGELGEGEGMILSFKTPEMRAFFTASKKALYVVAVTMPLGRWDRALL